MEERYRAAMVLAGVGDAMGYYNGSWEFNFVGEDIHKECKTMGGVEKLKIQKPQFIVSDDTVLLLATAEALIEAGNKKEEKDRKNSQVLYSTLAIHYKNDFNKDMNDRAPGGTTGISIHALKPLRENGWQIPFNTRGGGCGGAMRAMCIGLCYPNVYNVSCLENLIRVSVESGRMTHNHPTGFLGSFASALFGALAISEVSLIKWGSILLDLLPKVLRYVEKEDRDVDQNKYHWNYFQNKWCEYVKLRGIESGENEPVFPEKYDVNERDAFYKSVSFSGWGGASGHDAPLIAYDALLFARNNWVKLCYHGMLHGGDNDSTGVISGFCFGAMHGFHEVSKCNYEKVEYHKRLSKCGDELFKLAKREGYMDGLKSDSLPLDQLFV